MLKRTLAFIAVLTMLVFAGSTFFVFAEPDDAADADVTVEQTEQVELTEEEINAIIEQMTAEGGGEEAHAQEADEPAEMPMPVLEIILGSDGTSKVIFSQEMAAEELEQTMQYVEQSFGSQGYEVDSIENPSSLVISKTYEKEEGYVLDFNLPFSIGRYDFVEFKEFFSSRYGVKNTAFDLEEQPEGQEYLKIIIHTPVKPSLSTADVVSNGGKTNEWVVKSGSKNIIQINFKKINAIPTLSAVFAVIILLVLVYAAVKNRKQDGVEEFAEVNAFEVEESLNAFDESFAAEAEEAVEEAIAEDTADDSVEE